MLSQEELEIIGQIDIDEYQRRVIVHFRDGVPTEKAWRQMAYAVLFMSEEDPDEVEDVERAILAFGEQGTSDA